MGGASRPADALARRRRPDRRAHRLRLHRRRTIPTRSERTGLHALRNIDEISIVAAPGRVGAPDAGRADRALRADALPLRRARRAMPPPTTRSPTCRRSASSSTPSTRRSTTRGCSIPHPYPPEPGPAPDYPIPPSGHMVGIYARTDIERGVHKAPANEVVRGIIGLQRILNKGEQDILNPYPVNINVIRDFRANNRGIRVYGGRVITSDSRLEVRQRAAAADLHRGVDRPRAAVGGVRAQRRAAVGARAPLDHQLPDPGVAQRRARRARSPRRRTSSSATARR